MAKSKEQVLAMNLTAAEKKRAEDYFKSNERFGRPSEIDCNTVKEVKDFLADLQKNYEARRKPTKEETRDCNRTTNLRSSSLRTRTLFQGNWLTVLSKRLR